MLCSSPIKKTNKHGFSLSLSHMSVGNWHYSRRHYECQRSLLWAGDLSWVYTASRPKASGTGSNQGSPIILVYMSLVFPLDHSIIPWFSWSFLNLRLTGAHMALVQSGQYSGRKGHHCSLAPVLHVPKLPVLHFCWMNLYDWLLQVGHCETDAVTSMWVWVSLLTYLTCSA